MRMRMENSPTVASYLGGGRGSERITKPGGEKLPGREEAGCEIEKRRERHREKCRPKADILG